VNRVKTTYKTPQLCPSCEHLNIQADFQYPPPPRTLPKFPAQANIWRLLSPLDFDLVSKHIRFQMTKITSRLTPSFNTMKFKLT